MDSLLKRRIPYKKIPDRGFSGSAAKFALLIFLGYLRILGCDLKTGGKSIPAWKYCFSVIQFSVKTIINKFKSTHLEFLLSSCDVYNCT